MSLKGMYTRPVPTEGMPHAAGHEARDGLFYGVVRHGNASTTSLLKGFAAAAEADAHAQHFADELNCADRQRERDRAAQA